MTLLSEIVTLAETVKETQLDADINAILENAFKASTDIVLAEKVELEEDTAGEIIDLITNQCLDEGASADDLSSKSSLRPLKESLDEQHVATAALAESLTDESIEAINQILSESFEAAVRRIMKSDRKLRMKDKDGKPYPNRRRAAEAAVGASMRAAFGQKGMAKRAAAGKKG